MYEFSNPKLALKLIDEIIISGRFPNYVNPDSDEYDEDEVERILDKILDSQIVKVNKIPLMDTKGKPNGDILLSAEVINWDAYNELKENVK